MNWNPPLSRGEVPQVNVGIYRICRIHKIYGCPRSRHCKRLDHKRGLWGDGTWFWSDMEGGTNRIRIWWWWWSAKSRFQIEQAHSWSEGRKMYFIQEQGQLWSATKKHKTLTFTDTYNETNNDTLCHEVWCDPKNPGLPILGFPTIVQWRHFWY